MDDDPGPREEELEAGRLLFAQQCDFVTSVADETQVPNLGLTEVAFAGRSNVGKSALLNALTGRKTLARTSGTPGRTRLLNFFKLGGRLILVDLPGYGYARASKGEIARWTALTRNYLKGRTELRRVCLLIDARHGLKDTDRTLMKEFDTAAVSFQVVLTKADKMKPGALKTLIRKTLEELSRHPAAHPKIIATSAASGYGLPELRAALTTLAGPESTD